MLILMPVHTVPPSSGSEPEDVLTWDDGTPMLWDDNLNVTWDDQ